MSRVEKRQELRERLGKRIPAEERSDFNMDRWLDAYDEDIERCEEVIIDYLKNRRALGLDRPEVFDEYFDRPMTRNYYGVFSQSRLQPGWVNAYDNGIVFVETGVSDSHKASHAIRAGDFLYTFFGNCEYFLRLILEQERLTGRKSYAVCIFDMQYMSIIQYANPMAPINKIFEARIGLYMCYYAEVLSRVVIINPPRLLSVLLKIMSILVPAKILTRFHIAQCLPDIEKWISVDAIPVGFGGKKVVPGAELATGCNVPKELSKEDFLNDGMVWESHQVKPINYEHAVLGAGESWVKELKARKGQQMLYEYFANRNFEIKVENEKGDYLLPHLRMSTPLLAEEGAVPIWEDMCIRVELKNLSKLMKMKLRTAFLLIN